MSKRISYSPKYGDIYKQMKSQVEFYFESNNIEKQGGRLLLVRSLIVFTSFWFLYFLSFTSGLVAALSIFAVLGFMMSFMAVSIGHEATHQTFSSKKWVNKIFVRVIDLFGASSSYYRFKHNIHHHYTNVEGVDADIEFQPFLRMSKSQDYQFFHRFQYLYAPILYSLSSLVLVFLPEEIFDTSRVGFEYKKLNKLGILRFIVTKLFHIAIFLLVPIQVFGLLPGILLFFTLHTTASWYFSGFVIGSHIFDEAEFITPKDGKIDQEWAVKILKTTTGFWQNRFANIITSGTSYHVEHSLFPNISHLHYPAISKIIQDVAKQNDLPYYGKYSWFKLMNSHFKLLKNNSIKN